MNDLKLNEVFSKEPITFSIDIGNMYEKEWMLFRSRILGLPARPVRHKHFSRKTFKKALMAHRWSRDKAEYMCRLVAQSNGILSYDRIAEHACPWIFA